MIPRYSLPEMNAVWNIQNRLRNWLKVELAVTESWAELGKIPLEAAKSLKEKSKEFLSGEKEFNIKRINEIEEITNHDVIAFLTYLKEVLGEEA